MSLVRRWQDLAMTGAIITALTLAGCSSGTSSRAADTTPVTLAPTTTLAPTSPTCKSVKELATTLFELQKPSTFTQAGLRASVNEIRARLAIVKPALRSSSDASSVSDLESWVGDLEHAIKAPGSKGIVVRAGAAENVVTFGQAVLDALQVVCPTG